MRKRFYARRQGCISLINNADGVLQEITLVVAATPNCGPASQHLGLILSYRGIRAGMETKSGQMF